MDRSTSDFVNVLGSPLLSPALILKPNYSRSKLFERLHVAQFISLLHFVWAICALSTVGGCNGMSNGRRKILAQLSTNSYVELFCEFCSNLTTNNGRNVCVLGFGFSKCFVCFFCLLSFCFNRNIKKRFDKLVFRFELN